MIEQLLIYCFQFLFALFIRLGWHKYTDEFVRAINPFMILFLIIVQLYFAGTSYIAFILGLFLVDFLYYAGKRNNREIEVVNIITYLINLLPKKKERCDGES